MPAATKKIVNPEKEMRGKKPYNRNPDGQKKKTYQAKPAKLDQGEVPEGAAGLKKKLRDTLRMLSKNPKMPADVRQDHERRIEALKLQIAEKQVDQTEQKMATKYRMVKFFESKKADRKIKVFIRQHPEWESNAEEKEELEKLQLDLAYIQHFPKTLKYISLYPTENADDAATIQSREEIRQKIKEGLASGEITQFEKAAREEVKAKVLKNDIPTAEAIKITAEKINKGKKRTREDPENPQLAARAKATAEREATKPKEEAMEEVESFFETVPKVQAAKSIAAVTDGEQRPSKKKLRAAKRAEAEAAAATTATAPAASVTPASSAPPSVEGETKKLGKWARKAIRAQSTFGSTETSSAEAPVAAPVEASAVVEKEEPVEKKVAEKKVVEKKQPVEKKVAEKKQPAEKKVVEKKQPAEKKVAEKKQPAEKKVAEKKQPAEKKVAEKKVAEKKVAEKKVAEKKVVEKKVVEKKEPAEKKVAEKKAVEKKQPAKKAEEKKEEEKEDFKEVKKEQVKEVKKDEVKISTVKIARDDLESDSDDEPEAPSGPARKIVKVDETLLKELPPVPKRRGGRNLNKFKH